MKNNLGKVYFISNGKAIKIGYTKNEVSKRLNQLQTGSSDKLEIIYLLENSTMDTEKYLHKYFSEQNNIMLEWYDMKVVKEWIRRDKLTKQVLKEEGIIK